LKSPSDRFGAGTTVIRPRGVPESGEEENDTVKSREKSSK
jgi:hypothetical protein